MFLLACILFYEQFSALDQADLPYATEVAPMRALCDQDSRDGSRRESVKGRTVFTRASASPEPTIIG